LEHVTIVLFLILNLRNPPLIFIIFFLSVWRRLGNGQTRIDPSRWPCGSFSNSDGPKE
jgi:hypothetical protein